MAWPNGQEREVTLTIQASQVPSNLTNFPVLITRSNIPDEVVDPSGSNAAQTDGGDIRFQDTGENLLNCEIVHFEHDSTTGAGDAEIEIWVKIPSVDATTDTDFTMGYKTSGTTTQPAVGDSGGRNGVWTDYNAVWHLSEDASGGAGTIIDSTGNGHDLTPQSFGAASNATGPWGVTTGAINFDGSTEYLDRASAVIGSATQASLSAWGKSTNITDAQTLVGENNITDGGSMYRIGLFGNVTDDPSRCQAKIDGTFPTANSTTSYSADTWHYVTGRLDTVADEIVTLLDAAGKGTASYTLGFPASDSVAIGVRDRTGEGSGFVNFFSGDIDEVRITETALSDDWWTAEYNNQNSPSTFIVEGTPSGTGAEMTLGLATSTETAQALVLQREELLTLGLATSTETAQPVSLSTNLEMVLGLAAETTTAQAAAIEREELLTLGLATETTTAQALVLQREELMTLGLATETTTAQAVEIKAEQSIELGLATETTTAQAPEFRVHEATPPFKSFSDQSIASNSRDRPWNQHKARPAVYDPVTGKTYIAYQGAGTHPYTLEYDHETQTFSSPTELSTTDPDGASDSHGSPSINIDPADGHVHVVWGDHNTDLAHARFDNPNTISGAFTETLLSNASWTYATLIAAGGKLFIFGRHTVDATNKPLVYSKWNGSSWSATTTVIDLSDDWIYPSDYAVVGSKVYLSVYIRLDSNSVWRNPGVLVFDADAETFEAPDGTSMSLPIEGVDFGTNLRIEAAPDVFLPRVGVDETGNIHSFYWEESRQEYTHAEHDGSSWTLRQITPASADFAEVNIEPVVRKSTNIQAYIRNLDGDIQLAVYDGTNWDLRNIVKPDADAATDAIISGPMRIEGELNDDSFTLLIPEFARPADFTNDDLRLFALSESEGAGMTLGLATETTTAQPVTINAAGEFTLGLATETTAAQAVQLQREELLTLGLATSTETAQAVQLQREELLTLGLATSTETAQPVTIQVETPDMVLGLASSTETAQPVVINTAGEFTIGLASSTETAQAVQITVGSAEQEMTLGFATETTTAQALAMEAGEIMTLGLSTSTETAQAVTFQVGEQMELGLATSTEVAQAIVFQVQPVMDLGIAFEVDSARSVSFDGGEGGASSGIGRGAPLNRRRRT